MDANVMGWATYRVVARLYLYGLRICVNVGMAKCKVCAEILPLNG